jgi:pyruvate/2-oxoglutarate dehydrogenase complex dihydrolipoamide acyltransferase (E2) component
MLEIKVPAVGESITSGLLGVWSKPDGAYVQAGDPIFEIETDKVTSEVVAESAGLLKHLVKEGDTVKIGQVVANIDEKAPAPAAPAENKEKAAKKENGAGLGHRGESRDAREECGRSFSRRALSNRGKGNRSGFDPGHR